jgi:hypothetical protein
MDGGMIMELGPYKKREIELPPLFGHQMMVEMVLHGMGWAMLFSIFTRT